MTEAAREQLGYVQEGEVRKSILDLPPVPTDLPDGWPYNLVEGHRRGPPDRRRRPRRDAGTDHGARRHRSRDRRPLTARPGGTAARRRARRATVRTDVR